MTKSISIAVCVAMLCPALALCQSTEKSGSAKKADQGSAKKEEQKTQEFSVADGELKFAVPSNWEKVQPKIDFILSLIHISEPTRP